MNSQGMDRQMRESYGVRFSSKWAISLLLNLEEERKTTDRPGRRIKSPGGEGGWTRDICAEIADEGVISVF